MVISRLTLLCVFLKIYWRKCVLNFPPRKAHSNPVFLILIKTNNPVYLVNPVICF